LHQRYAFTHGFVKKTDVSSVRSFDLERLLNGTYVFGASMFGIGFGKYLGDGELMVDLIVRHVSGEELGC